MHSSARGLVRQRVPVPRDRGGTGNGGCDEPALATCATKHAVGGEPMQEGEEGLLAHAEGRARGVARQRGGSVAEEREGPLTKGIGRNAVIAHEPRPEPHVRVVGAEVQAQWRRAGRGPMLDAQFERASAAEATEIEVGVAEGVEVTGAVEGMAGDAAGGGFAGVMDEEDGTVGGAGEGAEAIEHGRHLGGRVFVGPVDTDERIEDEEPGLTLDDGGGEPIEALGRACGRRGQP